MGKTFEELADSGEIVSTRSLLAFDEDIYCRVCKNSFTLMDGNWEGTHPEYPGVKAFGIKCPHCERVNVSYYKTNTLIKLEKRIGRLTDGKHRDKAIRRYQREFVKVQKRYGEI
jgi:hypothetical protein